jgi:hypothetical protein
LIVIASPFVDAVEERVEVDLRFGPELVWVEVHRPRVRHGGGDARPPVVGALAEGGEHGGEVPAGRATDGADAGRVEAEVERVVPYPRHARLHVVDRGGEGMERCEAVVHRERHEALLRELAGERRG